MADELRLVVTLVDPASALRPGQSFAARAGVIGRAPEVDVVLADPTISRRHARLNLEPDGWSVETLAANHAVFVDGLAVAPGSSRPLVDGAELQLGGVLLAVRADGGTVPVDGPLAPPPAEALLVIRRDGDTGTVHLGARLLDMPPMAAVTLFALAQHAGQVVHAWDIQQAVGRPFNLPQAVSAVRRAFRVVFAEGGPEVAAMREAMRTVSGTSIPADDSVALARALIRSQRRAGYGVMLPAAVVRCDDVG